MRIFADLCVNRDVIDALQSAGFDIVSADQSRLAGAPDDVIFAEAQRRRSILLTFDRDFGNIVRFNILKSWGIVIVYIGTMSRREIIKRTLIFFEKMKVRRLKGSLFLIEKNRIRTWPYKMGRRSPFISHS